MLIRNSGAPFTTVYGVSVVNGQFASAISSFNVNETCVSGHSGFCAPPIKASHLSAFCLNLG